MKDKRVITFKSHDQSTSEVFLGSKIKYPILFYNLGQNNKKTKRYLSIIRIKQAKEELIGDANNEV
jgi:hypothetical protein